MTITPTTAIFLARALRDFGDGFIVILLPVYLTVLGFDALQIGLVATLALLGSAVLTLAIGLLGVRIDKRTLLLAASFLMILTGVAFALSSASLLILLIAFVGTINPSSGSVSIFVPLEHAVLSQHVADARRTHMFSQYSLIGALAAAAGALLVGGPDLAPNMGLERITVLKLLFGFYSLLGLAGAWCYASIPVDNTHPSERPVTALGPSKKIVYKLAALFSIDAFAGGFAVQALIALWLFNKFGLSLTSAGLFFFWSGVLAAFSFPVAASLARKIGLINTMVFTHIPSSLFLIAAALVPNLSLALLFLLARAALSQMDVPTRSSYVMAMVTPAERPAAASVTSVPRSLAAALSPAFAGALFAAGLEAWPLIICGVLKIAYDILLLIMFSRFKLPEEQ